MSAASVLSVDGMTCGHGVGTVQTALEGVGGVRRAEVDLASGVARVDADADAPLAALVAAVEAVGFGAAAASPETATTTLAVRGMTCARCEAWVADALRAVPGVAKVAVSVADGTARVEAASVSRAALKDAVRRAGYACGADAEPPAADPALLAELRTAEGLPDAAAGDDYKPTKADEAAEEPSPPAPRRWCPSRPPHNETTTPPLPPRPAPHMPR